ncbi:hypothetical protein Bca101_093294 [Brassica carinata]
MSKQWREADQAVESDRSSGGVRWIAGGGTSGVDLMEQVTERARWKSLEQTTEKVNRLSDRDPAFEVSVNGGMKKLLHRKAEAFLSNDYYESHLAWMDLASFEAFIEMIKPQLI